MHQNLYKFIPSPLVISWLILLASIFAAFSQIINNNSVLYISSDTLGLAGLYYDIFEGNGELKDWHLASSPSLFPDVFVFFIIISVFKSNVLVAIFIYAFLQISAVTTLLAFIYKKIAPVIHLKFSWLIPLFISLYFMESYFFSHDLYFSYFLGAHCYHLGPFLNALIILALYLGNQKPYIKYIGIFIIALLGSFSDKLFIVMLLVPFILSLLITVNKSILKTTLIILSCLVAGAFIGLYTYKFIDENKYLLFAAPHRIYDFNNVKPSLILFVTQMWAYITYPGFRSVQIIFTFLSVLGSFIFYFRRRKYFSFVLVFFTVFYFFFCGATFLAPIVNGNYTGFDTLRYNIPPFFLAAIPFALIVSPLLRRISFSKPILLKLGLFFIFIFTVFKISPSSIKNLMFFYPPDVSEIDEVAKKYHLKKGIGDYWTANKTTVLSRQHVKVLSVYADGYTLENGNNKSEFYTGYFDFVIENGLLPETKKKFIIKDTIKTKQYTIFIVEKFTYPQGTYAPVTIGK